MNRNRNIHAAAVFGLSLITGFAYDIERQRVNK